MNELYTPKKIKELSANARAQLIGKYPVAIVATLLISAIELTLTFISQANVMSSTTSGYLTGLVISLIIDLLLGTLIFGMANFYLKIARGQLDLNFRDLFRAFKGLTDKSILTQCVFTGFSLLALIPSILINFRILTFPEDKYLLLMGGVYLVEMIILFGCKLFFGLSFYILADNPEWSVPDIYRRSLFLMKKKKGKLFLAYLSCLPLLIISFMACGLGVFWFVPFFNTLMANFYLDAIEEEPWTPKLYEPQRPEYTVPPSQAPTAPEQDD